MPETCRGQERNAAVAVRSRHTAVKELNPTKTAQLSETRQIMSLMTGT